MPRAKRDPSVIDRSRDLEPPDTESEAVAQAESKKAERDAAVAKRDADPALSWVARTFGTGRDALIFYGFTIVLMIIVAAVVMLFRGEREQSSLAWALLQNAVMIVLGFMFGKLSGKP